MGSRLFDIALQDLCFTIIGSLAAAAVAAWISIGEPVKSKEDAAGVKAGQLTVEVRWPDSYCADVDTYVQVPSEARPISYLNRNTPSGDLVRDDLGCYGDTGQPLNLEVVFVRGLEDGWYAITVHYYRNAETPVPVDTVVTLYTPGSRGTVIAQRSVELEAAGDEETIVQFRLKDGQVVESNARPVSLFREAHP